MLSDIPRIPGWLGVIFRFIGAARNEIRSRAHARKTGKTRLISAGWTTLEERGSAEIGSLVGGACRLWLNLCERLPTGWIGSVYTLPSSSETFPW